MIGDVVMLGGVVLALLGWWGTVGWQKAGRLERALVGERRIAVAVRHAVRRLFSAGG